LPNLWKKFIGSEKAGHANHKSTGVKTNRHLHEKVANFRKTLPVPGKNCQLHENVVRFTKIVPDSGKRYQLHENVANFTQKVPASGKRFVVPSGPFVAILLTANSQTFTMDSDHIIPDILEMRVLHGWTINLIIIRAKTHHHSLSLTKAVL
jgi:hypothetical protein